MREWGAWGCVNREENDGQAVGYHLAMLQAHFMLGGNLFNSYNWNAINDNGRAIAYFNAFLDNLATDKGVVVAGEERGGDAWRTVTEWDGPVSVRPEFPWSNAIELDLKAPPTTAPLAVWLTQGVSGPVLAYAVVDQFQVNAAGTTRIGFGDLTRVEQDSSLSLHLRGAGWQARFAGDRPSYRLIADLRAERRRSQYLHHPSH